MSKTIPQIGNLKQLPTATALFEGGDEANASSTTLMQGFGQKVSTIAALAALPCTGVANGLLVYVMAFSTAGDGGVGPFRYNSSGAATPVTGVIVNATGGGQWERVFSGPVNARWFGAKGDGSNNDGPAIQLAVTYCLSSGNTLLIPSGTYLSSVAITGASAPVSIIGESVSNTRVVFTATTGGFSFALNAQGVSTPPQRLMFMSLTIETRAAVSSPALNATWSTYQPNAQGSCWISDLNITRKDDGTGSFAAGVRLNKCIIGFIDRVVILGDDSRVSVTGIDLIDCVGITSTGCHVNRYQNGSLARVVSASQTEGIYYTDCFFYDVYCGIDVLGAIHIELGGTHININGASATACVKFHLVSQSAIDETCLFYAGGIMGDASNQDGVQLTSCNGVRVSCQLTGTTKANTRYGVALIGSSSYCQILGVNFAFFTTGISAGAVGDTNNTMVACTFYQCTTPVDEFPGTDNFKADNAADGAPISNLRWGASSGGFRVGEVSADANWGGYFRGRSGANADLSFADSANVIAGFVKAGAFFFKSYTVATLPSASVAAGFIYVSDETGGAVPAFSDGTNWRRVTDRAIVS